MSQLVSDESVLRALQARTEQMARRNLRELGQAACAIPAVEALLLFAACRDLFLAQPQHLVAPAQG